MVRRHRKQKTWRRKNKQKHSPPQKKRFTTRVAGSHKSKHSTDAIFIEYGIDWGMIKAKQVVRRHRNLKRDGDKTNKNTQLDSKNRLTSRATGFPQIQAQCHNPHQMRHRLMYDTGETNGEKASKTEKVTATKQKNHSPWQKKSPYDSRRRFRADPNTLPQSAWNEKSIDV